MPHMKPSATCPYIDGLAAQGAVTTPSSSLGSSSPASTPRREASSGGRRRRSRPTSVTNERVSASPPPTAAAAGHVDAPQSAAPTAAAPVQAEARTRLPQVLSTLSISPPASTATSPPGVSSVPPRAAGEGGGDSDVPPLQLSSPQQGAPGLAVTLARPGNRDAALPVSSGVCRFTRRELDNSRDERVGKGDGSFGPHPLHLVHFTDKWVCTGCGHPIVHHFDCVRSLEELDRDRARRIRAANSTVPSAMGSDDEDEMLIGGRTPSVLGVSAPGSVLSTPRESRVASLAASGIGSPANGASLLDSGMTPPSPMLDFEGHAMLGPGMDYGPDPQYLTHFEGGQWVCSFPACRQPIEVHRSVPSNRKARTRVYEPPEGSRLNVLARYVGRVGVASPRLSGKSKKNGSDAGGGSKGTRSEPGSDSGSYATSNAAHRARVSLGNAADVCSVCGWPDKRPWKNYPAFKTNKHGDIHGPSVTMAHVLSPDALSQVGFDDDVSNYIPLCGTLGWDGTCHDAFDKNLLLFAYEGGRRNDGRFLVWASDPHYLHLSGSHVVLVSRPHRSALHARARHALTSAQVTEAPDSVSVAIVRQWHVDEAAGPSDTAPVDAADGEAGRSSSTSEASDSIPASPVYDADA